jgi:hypothetical protein
MPQQALDFAEQTGSGAVKLVWSFLEIGVPEMNRKPVVDGTEPIEILLCAHRCLLLPPSNILPVLRISSKQQHNNSIEFNGFNMNPPTCAKASLLLLQAGIDACVGSLLAG